jgi:hypothetical protein
LDFVLERGDEKYVHSPQCISEVRKASKVCPSCQGHLLSPVFTVKAYEPSLLPHRRRPCSLAYDPSPPRSHPPLPPMSWPTRLCHSSCRSRPWGCDTLNYPMQQDCDDPYAMHVLWHPTTLFISWMASPAGHTWLRSLTQPTGMGRARCSTTPSWGNGYTTSASPCRCTLHQEERRRDGRHWQ